MDVPVVPDVVRARVAAVTHDFVRSEDRAGFLVGNPGYGSDVPADLARQPAILRFLLEHVLGLADLGRFEKVAWECVFRFRDIPGSIADQKLGVRLYLGTPSRPEAQELRRHVVTQLREGLEIVERDFLTSYAQQRLRTDDVTVLNQAGRLREMYEYFIEGARLGYSGEGRISEHTSGGHRILHRETEGYFNSVATVAAYFSWLEHVLALSLPFVPSASRSQTLAWFLRQPWHRKWSTVLDAESGQRARSVYDRLRIVAGQYRNPQVHGAINAASGTLGFHLPGCGAVSMTLRQAELTPSLYLLPFDRRGFDQARRSFDAADRMLKAHRRTRYAMQWAAAGLDVAYDQASRREYGAACISDQSFAAFLEVSSYKADMHANMDW